MNSIHLGLYEKVNSIYLYDKVNSIYLYEKVNSIVVIVYMFTIKKEGGGK